MISVTILTKNSEKYICAVLDALKSFDEVLVYDTGSSDQTMDFVKNYPNVSLHEGPFIGFGPTHNRASSLAKNDWILSIDSDEVVSPELNQEIQDLSFEENTVYAISRQNLYNGKWIRGCGWSPDWVFRLYNRSETAFSQALVHETIVTQGSKIRHLQNPLKHYSYESVTDFIEKMQSYSELFAEQNMGKRKSNPCKAVLHSVYTFLKSYFFKRGFLGGYEGLLISSYQAHTAFYKYLKLYEANLKADKMRRCPAENGR